MQDFDYGRCPCTGDYKNRTVELRLTFRGRRLVLHAVPLGECNRCGNRVYKPDTLERIEAIWSASEGTDTPESPRPDHPSANPSSAVRAAGYKAPRAS